MSKLSENDTVKIFRVSDLDMGNAEMWTTIVDEGQPLVFGDKTEIKHALWLTSNAVFEGEALNALRKGEMPEGWLFCGNMVRGYIDQFDNEEMWKGFEYTYAERLLKFEVPNPDVPKTVLGMFFYVLRHLKLPPQTKRINQMKHMREQLIEAFNTGIQSTRIVADLGQPHLDWGTADIPCLRCIQILPLPGNKVEVHLLFRSHDYGNGIMPNLAMLINAINKHVVLPAGGVISKVVLTSWVAHLYDTDASMYEPIVEKYRAANSAAACETAAVA